jgi:hypothetical protein
VIACDRCGVPLRVSRDRNEDARVLRHAAVPKGVCAGCAITRFLKTTEPLATVLRTRGPQLLLVPQVQQQAARVLSAGKSDADPVEIDWQAVVDRWELP